MNHYYFLVDGLATMIEAETRGDAFDEIRAAYPDSSFEFIREDTPQTRQHLMHK